MQEPLTPDNRKDPVDTQCPDCDGAGFHVEKDHEGVVTNEITCERCGGSGVIWIPHDEWEEGCLDDKADLEHDDI